MPSLNCILHASEGRDDMCGAVHCWEDAVSHLNQILLVKFPIICAGAERSAAAHTDEWPLAAVAAAAQRGSADPAAGAAGDAVWLL